MSVVLRWSHHTIRNRSNSLLDLVPIAEVAGLVSRLLSPRGGGGQEDDGSGQLHVGRWICCGMRDGACSQLNFLWDLHRAGRDDPNFLNALYCEADTRHNYHYFSIFKRQLLTFQRARAGTMRSKIVVGVSPTTIRRVHTSSSG